MAVVSGALFGMAAQTALRHFALDLGVVTHGFMFDGTGQTRSALAWWAWWFVGVAAFFVGRLSVALTRCLAANWWLFRGARLTLSAGLVLGLAVVGQLRAAPLPVDLTMGVALGAAVAATTALLSLFGAQSARAFDRKAARPSGLQYGRRCAWTPVPYPRPLPGGGSVNSGLRAPRFRSGPRPLPQPGRLTRWALAAALAVPVFAAVVAVSSATVLRELVPPTKDQNAKAHALLASDGPPVMTQVQAIAVAAMPPAAVLPATGIARSSPVIPMSESELTFAKGYAVRRAARDAAAKLELMSKTTVGSASAVESGAVVEVGRASAPHVAPYRRGQHDKAHAAGADVRLVDRHGG